MVNETVIKTEYKNSEYRDSALEKAKADMAVVLAKSGDIARAWKTAAEIQDKARKNLFCMDIAKVLAESGDIAGAKAIAARIEDRGYISKTYMRIAVVQFETGDLSGAETTVAEMKYEADRPLGYWAISEAQKKSGDFAGAAVTARKIGDINIRASAYTNIACALVERVFHDLNDADVGHLRMGRIDEHVAFGRHQGRGNTKEKLSFDLAQVALFFFLILSFPCFKL